jgi:hypothetical protein
MIFHLEDGSSTLQKGDEILNHATDYYKALFGPSDKPLFGLDPNCWTLEEKVTDRRTSC